MRQHQFERMPRVREAVQEQNGNPRRIPLLDILQRDPVGERNRLNVQCHIEKVTTSRETRSLRETVTVTARALVDRRIGLLPGLFVLLVARPPGGVHARLQDLHQVGRRRDLGLFLGLGNHCGLACLAV